MQIWVPYLILRAAFMAKNKFLWNINSINVRRTIMAVKTGMTTAGTITVIMVTEGVMNPVDTITEVMTTAGTSTPITMR